VSRHPVFTLASSFLSTLEAEGIPYMLMGGLSVRFWALPRPTYDLDVTISADESRLGTLLLRLEEDGFLVPPEVKKGWTDVLAGMKKVSVRKFIDRDSWRVDIFLVTTEYQRAAFSRRRRVKLLGKDVWSISPEDLILHKLIAGRERDLADVAEILAVTRDLDLAYLRRWAQVLGIASILDDRLARAGLT